MNKFLYNKPGRAKFKNILPIGTKLAPRFLGSD